tara:strand:- start:1261 stop:3183 length:1923 start_codon:yes stop_codon:yes gene_type:complete
MAEEIRTLPSGVQYKVIDGVYGGLVGTKADIASMTNAYNQQSTPTVAEALVEETGTVPVNLQEQILETGSPTFSSGSPTQALPAAPAPTQTTEDLVSALGDATESDTETYKYSGDKTGKTVTFADGSVLTQRGYRFEYEDADGNPLELDIQPGLKQSVDSKNEALSKVVGGIKRDLTEDVYGDFGGEDGTLVSEYLSDQAALAAQRAKSDERQDAALFGTFDGDVNSPTYGQRTGGTMQDLNDQVKKEADALGISTDEYYKLPVPMRVSMGLSDIGELFGESNIVPSSQYGGLLGDYNLTEGSSGLGTLSSENLSEYSDLAKDYLSKNYAPNYSPSLDTMDAMYYADVGPADTYSPSLDTMDAMYDADVGGIYTPPVSKTSDFEIFGDTGKDIYSIGGVQIGPGGPSGPGAGSNSGGGGVVVPPVVPPVVVPPDGPGGPEDPDNGGGGIGVGVPVIGPGDIGGGTGGGIGSGVPVAGTMPDPSTYIVPSTANYGTDPRFKNLAPTYNVSKAAMPIFNRFDPDPSIPIVPVEEEETSLLAQGGIVSLAGGGTPKGQGISPDFMVDSYYPSLIPKALDGNKAAKEALLEAHSKLDNFTLPEELLLRIKRSFRHGGVAERGYSHDGVGSLSDTARNMFRPMVG